VKYDFIVNFVDSFNASLESLNKLAYREVCDNNIDKYAQLFHCTTHIFVVLHAQLGIQARSRVKKP